ncbi:MAG: ATP-dependent DNA helicase RecG [Patescibacteria group bacterium]|nr:ATP-dependent DNA helicase RecG [Patescibacteria group bacterium]
MLTLTTEIIKITRVGKTTAAQLKRLGIETVQDLLFYFPFRYDDFSKLTPINKLQPGTRANIVGQIELIQNKRSPRKRMYITEALVNDGTETIKIIWFNQPFIARNLRVGDKVSLAGKVDGGYGEYIMKSPIYEKVLYPIPPLPALSDGVKIRGGNERDGYHTQGLVPNYHLTANLTQKQIRFLIKQIIGLANKVVDWLPSEVKSNLKILDLAKAITKIHFPKTQNDIKQARKRLAFNEFFLIQLQSQLIKQELKSSKAQIVPFLEQETKKFVDHLPFKLTDAQKKAAWEILRDINKDQPMARLLEGDVGSGKTVVALIAMLNAALNKKQSVLMAPTEILANQHFESVCQMLADFDARIGLLTRSARRINTPKNAKERQRTPSKDISKKKMVEMIRNSEVDIIIGTHALIQEDVEFKNLVLAIIDEQHRFGVEQRKMLAEKSEYNKNQKSIRQLADKNQKFFMPHLLSMTATPIPRSLAMALYGDLDISIIDEMPIGRKKIATHIVPENKRNDAYKFIREQIKQGRQVFVICPLIDFSDKLGVKFVKEEFKKLDEQVFPDLKIGFLHGRIKSKEKERIMQDFLDNKIKILVSTSIVEVGVDVVNATIIMIECADRFGLAQLHQFRGRVGRSDHQSYCFLFSDNESDKSIKRLQALVNCNDGFALAKMDLKFRGPGQVYGTAQKGFPELKIATLFDYQLMKQARDEAVKLVNKDASLASWPELEKKLVLLDTVSYLTG